MPAGLSCAKRRDKGRLCARLALDFRRGPSKVKDQQGHEVALEVTPGLCVQIVSAGRLLLGPSRLWPRQSALQKAEDLVGRPTLVALKEGIWIQARDVESSGETQRPGTC